MYCPKCGAENPAGARFCGTCGAPFSAPAPQPTPQPYPQPAPRPMPAVVAGPFSTPALVATIAVAAAGVCTLLPWVDLNIGAIPNAASSLSQLGISSVVSLTLSAATSGLGTVTSMLSSLSSVAGGEQLVYLQQITSSAGILGAVLSALSILGAASLALASIAVFNAITSRGSDLRVMVPAGGVIALTAVGWIALLGFVNSSISSFFAQLAAISSSTIALGTLFSPTPFTWIALLGGLAATILPLLIRRGIIR